MPKVKLGELIVDLRIRVRKELDLDHVECLLADLQNGAKFPPLRVEPDTKTIIGGVHRFDAYRRYYGPSWEEIEVDYIPVELPPYREDPNAWLMAALLDNKHLAKKLTYNDRYHVASDMLRNGLDPKSDRATKELAPLLHKTPGAWGDYAEGILDMLKRRAERIEKPHVDQDLKQKNESQDLPGEDKQISSEIYDRGRAIMPGASKLHEVTPRARLQNWARKGLEILPKFSSGQVTKIERELLEELKECIDTLLEQADDSQSA